MAVPVWLDDEQYGVLAALDRMIPPDEGSPGAAAGGAADYVDGLLGAFSFDPPRIWAGGPFSGRHGGEAGFEEFVELGAAEELAWRIRMGVAPVSRHIMGTCRMGDDPSTSVTDPFGRFWDVENLHCGDSSVFVTSSGYNPTLTLVALAHRMAASLAGKLPARSPVSG